MKKAIAILLSLMIVVSSSIIAVNAENIKDIFGTNDVSSPLVIMDDEEELPELSDSRDSSNLKGATNLFTIGDISYSSTYHSYNDQSYYTGSANKSSRDQIDYRLTIQATIVASASATTGNFIVPLDYIYDTSGSYYSSPNTPYFKNFKYKVGDGAENSATIQTGKIAGTEGTSKYISIPLSSPQNMESELNIYITCDFEMKHIANVKKNTMFFKNFYVTSGSDVVASKEYALNSWHSNVISYHYFNSQVIKPKHIYRGLEIGKISERVELSFDDFSFDSYNQIPMLDTDYPLVQTITVSKGAQITLDSKIASKYTVTGSVANGWTITRKFNAAEIINAYTELTSNPICGSSVTSISNSTPFECTINVPSDQKDITEINISNKIIAYTKEYGSTGEISTKNISLTVLDPIQDLDGSAGMNESTYSYSLDLNNTSDEVSFGSIRYLRSNGMLDIPDVSVTWFNDSSFPARIKSVKNIWRTNCPADLSIVITNGSTRKTVTKNDVAYNSSITFGTEASNDVVLASNEWIESIKSTPYYINNGTKVYAIKYDQRSTSSNCFNFTFGLPLNKKNLATGATIVDNDCSKFSYELSYRYIYNGDQEDTLYNNTDYNSATGMAKFRKENAYYLIYTTGHPAYGAYVQVTNNNDITQLGQSGDQTKKINSNLYVFNSAKDNSATEANITSYNKNIIENTKWHNPLLTVVFPRGVKLDTSSNVLSRQSDTVYKYTIEENRSDNVITDTVVTLTKVKEENNQETWRISIPCVLRRLDRSSVSPTTSHYNYITYMPLPLVLNSKAYAGSQLFTIYASASHQPATPIGCDNYSLKDSVSSYFLKNNPEVKGDVISDTSNIDGNASTSQVCKISNVRAFDVSPSYDIVFSSQYKKDGVFVDVASTATALTVTADETIDFRTLIKSTGNAMLSKITITDTFPNFFSGPSTYVPGSLTIEILNADGTVKKDVKDYTLDTSTTGKIIANLGENNVLLPGETIRVTGQFKARDDIRPNYPANNTVSIDSYIGSTKTETHTFNQPYKSEIASKDLTVRVFLDYNGNGVYDSTIDKPVKSASVKTSMTTTDDNAFANTQTITTPTVAINYGSVEYGSYRVDVSNIKDTRGYSLNNVSNRAFTITLAEVRAGGTKVFDVPITPEYYLVKFDKNATDATGTMADQKFTFGVAQSLSSNAFSRTGYTFDSWNTKSDGTGAKYTNGQSVTDLAKLPLDEITLYAQWTPNKSTVTVNPNGGSWTHSGTAYTESKDFTQNYNTTLTVELPTRTGYTFTGWTFGGNKNGKFSASTTSNSTYTFGAVAGKVDTITAGWTINASKVTVDPNGGSWTHSGTAYTESKDFTQNYNTTLTVELPTRTGYTFTGWTFGGDKNGKFSASTTGNSTYTFGAVAGKVDTITAGWTINASKVIVNPNGGIWTHSGTEYTESKDFTQNYNTTLTVELPTRTGYTFTGWTFGGDKNGKFSASTTGNSTYTFGAVAGKVDTITAGWTINASKVTVNPNGGIWTHSGTEYKTSEEFTQNYNTTLTVELPTRTGYTFTGWTFGGDKNGKFSASTTGNSTYTFGAVAGKSDTLTAGWLINKSKVIVDPNGGSWTHSGTAYTESQDFTQDYNTTLTVELPTRTGYTFTGWTFGGDKNGKFSASTTDNSTYTFGAVAGKADIITAGWTINASKVTVDPNGGSWTHSGTAYTESQDFTQDYNTTLTVELPTRTGYTFTGWTFGGDKNGSFTPSETDDSTYVFGSAANKNDTITATWEINGYELTVIPNGGEWENSSENRSFPMNYNSTKEISDPTRIGYTFTGWSWVGAGSTFDKVTKLFTMGYEDAKLLAGWEPIKYTVHFDGNNATSGEMEDQEFIYDVAQNLTKNDFTKTGYTFIDWADDSGNSYTDEQLVKNLASEDGATVNLYAQWKVNEYTVHFNGNGATSGEMEDQKFIYDVAQNLTKNDYTKTGYTFINWLDESGNAYTDEQLVEKLSAEDGAIINLDAQWKVHGYTVHFNGNGATSGEMEDQKFIYDVAQNLTKNDYTKTGYTFINWLDESGNAYTDEQLVEKLSAEDGAIINLDAQWKVHGYKVHFEGNGATSGEMADQNFVYDVAQNLSENGFTKVGYTFIGWLDDADNKYTDKQSVINLTSKDGDVITLEAQWKVNEYTIHFDGNGATSGQMEDQNFEYDVPENLTKNLFEKTGHTFNGWKDPNGVVYNDEQLVEKLSAIDGDLIEFTAQWSINEYNLTVIPNNGVWNGDTEDQQFKMDFNATKEIADPTRNGYTFTGWSLVGAGASFDANTKIFTMGYEDATLTATWSINIYKLTVKLNGGNINGLTDDTTTDLEYQEQTQLTTPERYGYTFTGWGVTGIESSVDSDGIFTMGYEDAIATAQWTPNLHKITYHGVEGLYNDKYSYVVDTVYGELITVDENKFYNDNFVFVKWNTEKDGSGTDYSPLDTFNMPDEDIILYAQWILEGYHITYYANGGISEDGLTEHTIGYSIGSFATIEDCMFTREGYKFIGWGEDENVASIYDERMHMSQEIYLDGENLELYAIWEKLDGGHIIEVSDDDTVSDTTIDTTTDTTTDTISETDTTSDISTDTSTDTTSDTTTDTSTDTESDTESDEPIPEKPLYGDVNCDGVVNMEDVAALQKIMAKLSTHEDYGAMSRINSDCDHNDVINMIDVTEIQKFMAKLIPDLDP